MPRPFGIKCFDCLAEVFKFSRKIFEYFKKFVCEVKREEREKKLKYYKLKMRKGFFWMKIYEFYVIK